MNLHFYLGQGSQICAHDKMKTPMKKMQSTWGFQIWQGQKGEAPKERHRVKSSSLSAHYEVLLQPTKGMLDLRVQVSKLFSQENLTRKLHLPAVAWAFAISDGE